MSNLSGSRRPFAGAARDFLLGFRAVSGRGEIFKSGGKVVKNVTGFDLSKLITGSYGTLAAVSEMTLKTHPKPEHHHSFALPCDTIATAREIMKNAINSAFAPSGAAYLPPALPQAARKTLGASGVVLRYEGGAAPLKAAANDLQKLGEFKLIAEDQTSQALWRKIAAAEIFNYHAEAPHGFLWKISLPPQACAHLIETLQTQNIKFTYFADWGGGLIWLYETHAPSHHTAIRSQAERLGGYAHLIRATQESSPESPPIPRFHPRPKTETDLLKNIKYNFDPHNILNPHKLGF